MVVAARYSQWISDRLRWEIPYWRRQDLQTAEKMSAYWPDEAAWYRVQQQAIEEPTVELTDEPPFPAALREIHHLRRLDNPAEKWAEQAEHVRAHRLNEANAVLAQLTEDITAHRFDTICETLEEVTGAIARSQTSHTDNLLEPVRALITWLRPSES